jgi:hypothetical protein
MGGDDSQKLLPWRGIPLLSGAQQNSSLLQNQHCDLGTPIHLANGYTATRYSIAVTEAVAEINECRSLFLADVQDLGRDGIRVVIAEGLPAGPAAPIEVAGTIIPDCTPIEATDQSRIFEIVWRCYVGYSVLNESYAAVHDFEQYDGTRFRIYSKSHFIDYMSLASFASDGYPGPTQHYCVACEDHILHVLSTEHPTVKRLR